MQVDLWEKVGKFPPGSEEYTRLALIYNTIMNEDVRYWISLLDAYYHKKQNENSNITAALISMIADYLKVNTNQ
jgi:hypothetical protein